MNVNKEEYRSGFIGIIGAPNGGKSTLLNQMLKEKISITSQKPQTTRNRILGVLHQDDAQLVFIDTPGIHKAKTPLNERMVEAAITLMADVDLLLIVADVTATKPKEEAELFSALTPQKKPVLLALNKIDLIAKEKLLPLTEAWMALYPFHSVIPISAKLGDQVDVLIAEMKSLLPLGPPLFPEDALTDQSERFMAAEIIREKVFRLTGQEIPYATAVTVDRYKFQKKHLAIDATIHVERDSQKGIIIGKGGNKLKQIGEDARLAIESFTRRKVYLKLFVRVQKNWSSDTKALRKFGY